MTTHALRFRFSGKIARLLGRESVSSDVAALFELVKNGYDADASKVTIDFQNFSVNGGKDARIIVTDDGDGMTLNDIENNWMVIGTESKEKHPRTRKGRTVVGNKGIGRFATEKLARKVDLISKPRQSKEEIRLSINWDEYEKVGVTFDDVAHAIEINPEGPNPLESGVKIILTNLRERWTEQKIMNLRKAISSLVLPPPLQQFTKDSFSVEVLAPEFKIDKQVEVPSALFDKAPFKLTAAIPENRNDYTVTISKSGQIVRQEAVDLRDKELSNGEVWQPFGKAKLTIYFFPGKSRYEDWDRYYKDALNIAKIRAFLMDKHGVKIYRDGFWVRPYGEPGNDWLSLEAERVQSNLNIGNSQVIGIVEITRDRNPMILDTTTRERLVENTAFEALRDFVKASIDILNQYRKDENKQLREEQRQIRHQAYIESEIRHLKELVDANVNLGEQDKRRIKRFANEISFVFSDYKKEVQENYERLEETEKAYRNLASLGISSATASHEIINVIGPLSEIPKGIGKKLRTATKETAIIRRDLQEAAERIDAIKQFMMFIREYVSNLTEYTEANRKKRNIKVGPLLRNMRNRFKGILMDKKVEIELKVIPKDLSVYMNSVDLQAIFMNLLTNSLKAVNRLSKGSKKKILVTVQKDPRYLSIRFSDNGIGVKDADRPKIFRLFYTTYKDGTGLGLPIIKEIVEEYRGKIELESYSEIEQGATFQITIPAERVKK